MLATLQKRTSATQESVTSEKTSSDGLTAIVIGLVIAVGIFYLCNPPLWHHPIDGFRKFVHLNLNRDQYNVAIMFFGKIYDLKKTLPWYNTILWVLMTIPVLFLFAIPFGLRRIFSKNATPQFGILLVSNALILLLVRAFPGTPPHDGVRLFVVAFTFLAIIAGIGLAQIGTLNIGAIKNGVLNAGHLRREVKSTTLRLIGGGYVLLALTFGVSNLVLYSPQWLSYYNIVIGGVDGAVRNGLEATYYWDTLDAEVIDWLNENTDVANEKILFAPTSSKTLMLVKHWEHLAPDFRPDAPGHYRWYLMQHRNSAWRPIDRWLLENAKPAYTKTIRFGRNIPGVDAPVTILSVYSATDFVQGMRALSYEKRNTQ